MGASLIPRPGSKRLEWTGQTVRSALPIRA